MKKDFKMTEVGEIPEDIGQTDSKNRVSKQSAMQELVTGKKKHEGFKCEWKNIFLGEVLHVCYGKEQKKINNKNGIYPILGSGGEIGRSNYYLSEGPSVLVGRKGTIDKPQYVETPFWTIDTLFYTEFAICHYPKFFYYLFCLINFKKFNEASGVPSLNANNIENIQVKIPEPKEQIAIAEILSDMDSLISSLEDIIAKKRLIKQGTMRELLTGKKRLPGFKGEWKITQLNKCLNIYYGIDQNLIKTESGKYPILGSGGIIGKTDQYLSDKPSVLIGRVGTINNPIYIDIPFWTINTLFYTTFSRENNPKFFYYLFCIIDWKNLNSASGVPRLDKKDIENISVVIPLLPEQAAIAEILSGMDEEISALEEKLAKTRQIKAGMMEELLTGKIRLL